MNIINEIDKYLLNKEFEKKKRESYYPSEVSQCTRKSYYKWIDKEISDPIEAGGLWKMSMGNKIHELIAEFLKLAGWEIDEEVEFKKDIGLKYPISGRIDIVAHKDGKKIGIENKTGYGNGVRVMRKTGLPKVQDAEQVLLYMFCNPDIKEFYLVYVARDDGYRMQFVFDYRNDLICCEGKPVKTSFVDLINRYAVLEDHIDNKLLPERQYRAAIKNGQLVSQFQKNKVEYKTDWQCSYCQYKTECYRDDLIKYKNGDNSELWT